MPSFPIQKFRFQNLLWNQRRPWYHLITYQLTRIIHHRLIHHPSSTSQIFYFSLKILDLLLSCILILIKFFFKNHQVLITLQNLNFQLLHSQFWIITRFLFLNHRIIRLSLPTPITLISSSVHLCSRNNDQKINFIQISQTSHFQNKFLVRYDDLEHFVLQHLLTENIICSCPVESEKSGDFLFLRLSKLNLVVLVKGEL